MHTPVRLTPFPLGRTWEVRQYFRFGEKKKKTGNYYCSLLNFTRWPGYTLRTKITDGPDRQNRYTARGIWPEDYLKFLDKNAVYLHTGQ